jgi:SAM-dependent methyltransferase
MPAWSDGYNTEIQYTSHFYPELAPGFMAFACLRQGVRPPALGPGSAYLELGCGQGFGLNLLAATNPDMTFQGVDFNPGQIDNATRLARAAGLSNVSFGDLSFEQFLALPDDRTTRFEVIALHGVYSWVSPENRKTIVQILDRLLKPGGMAYVSYNCLPGWAPLVPLQRFIADHVAGAPGDPQVRVVAALRAAMQMLEGNAGYFLSDPTLKRRIEEALAQKPAYLVHEYLNEHSHPFFHTDVAREMEGARLSFAASANIADDLVNLAVPAPLQPLVRDTQDRAWRQTLLDYAGNKPFRRDIFVRGRNMLDRAERDALLDETRLTLLTAPDAVTFEFPIPIGRLQGPPGVYRPIVEALAGGPRTYGELARLPQLAGLQDGVLLQAVTLLVGGRQIHPAARAEGGHEAAAAFNRALFDRLGFDEAPTHLASGVAGTAVRVEFTDLAALSALARGEDDPTRTAARAWEIMARTGRRLLRDGKLLQDQAANEAELVRRLKAFGETQLPVFRGLGAI